MERCLFCGQIADMIWVHGHYQCSRCHQIVTPCCNGETAQAVEPWRTQPARNDSGKRTTR